MWGAHRRVKEGPRCARAGVTRDCELSDMGAGN